MKDEILRDFVKKLVDEFPLGDANAVKIFKFYKKYIKENENIKYLKKFL